MLHHYTAAAERALIYASRWSARADCDELEAASLVLGLLAEPECRAATILARHGIDLAAVRHQWPKLSPSEGRPAPKTVRRLLLSREVDVSLQLARQRLIALLRPLELATEHLLLGLAAADHEVAVWLRHRGLDPDHLEAEIYELYGYHPVPVCLDEPHEQEMAAPSQAAPLAELPAVAEPVRCDEPTAAIRILDAAANRAREGLRVIEDYVRFVLDDQNLTGLCKQLRHALTAALGHIPAEHRLASRETQADVGTPLSTDAETSRANPGEVLAANFARLQESLRSLEEFGKIASLKAAAAFKQLRYETYTLQRAVEITRTSLERLADARLYVLIDGRESIEQFERLVRDLIAAGVGILQLRDKSLSDRELLDRAKLLHQLTQGTGTLFVMNDRPDLAALARADGVHLGQEELCVKDARSIVGPHMLIGVSTHNIEQARQAVLDGANYIGVGPTFPSDTKRFTSFPGIDFLRQVATEIRLPAFAIGGIGPQNIDQVLAAGLTRIAVSGAVTLAANPAEMAGELLQVLGSRHGGTESTEKKKRFTAEDAKDAARRKV
jgi:thiamine-phosphate pyrophosphorylase